MQVGPVQARQPLSGRTVLVTRARAQSGEMTSRLESFGATVIHCPTIEIIEPDSWRALDRALKQIESYDWIIFTSSNGANFFFRRLAYVISSGTSQMRNLTICAIGPSTAKAIEAAGVRVDLVAKDSKAEGAFKAIVEYIGGEEKLRGVKFLIPRARIARDLLPVELGKLGAQVEAVEAYQTVRPHTDAESIIRRFMEGSIDAITFTSSSTVSNFASLVGLTDLSDLLKGVAVACIGPITATTASEHGLKDIIQPEVYTSTAMIEALAQVVGPKPEHKT